MHGKFYLSNVEENQTFGIAKSKQQADNKIGLNTVRWYGSKYKPVSGIFDSKNVRNFCNG